MQLQAESHIFTGLQQDTSISKHSSEYLVDAHNIRITAREGNTLLSITNEKGTKELSCDIPEYNEIYLSGTISINGTQTLTTDITINGESWRVKADGEKTAEDVLTVTGTLGIKGIVKRNGNQIKGNATGDIDITITDKIEIIGKVSILGTLSKEDGTLISGNIVISGHITLTGNTGIKGGRRMEMKPVYDENTTILGHCVLNNYIVLFVHNSTITDSSPDNILRVDLADNTPTIQPLYQGSTSLGFDVNYPIESFSSYENKNIQKVYWTDGKNQPRVINIVKETPYIWEGAFDFVPTLNLKEEVIVERKLEGLGSFHAGVIQYAFTYYNKYGQESNIFYTTKLLPIAFNDRGGNPEEIVTCSFNISVTNLDYNFEYIRIYSIQRTSVNATPNCKRLIDLPISGTTISYIDTGTNGDNIDPTELLYKGGESIIAETLTQKDNTLFLGNLKLERPNITDIKTAINNVFKPTETSYTYQPTDTDTNYVTTTMIEVQGNVISSSKLPYTNSVEHSGFKHREIYRIGIQFQYKTGKWSEPIWLRDYKINPSTDYAPSLDESTGKLKMSQIKVHIEDTENSSIIDSLISKGYKKARLLMAESKCKDRTIICQGIANTTLYTQKGRYATDASGHIDTSDINGSLYAQPSWIFRPIQGNDLTYGTTAKGLGGYIPSEGTLFDLKQMEGLWDNVNNIPIVSPKLRSSEIGTKFISDDLCYRIDPLCVTIHTPELIFDTNLYSLNWSNVIKKLYAPGYVTFTSTFGDIDIQTSTPPIGGAAGFIHNSVVTTGDAALISGLYYQDYVVDDNQDSNDNPYCESYRGASRASYWPVYMWHKTGSLNNDINRTGQSAILSKKKISNYHLATNYTITNPNAAVAISDIQLFQSNEAQLVKIDGHPYMGNIDSVVITETPIPKYFAGSVNGTESVSIASTCNFKLWVSNPTAKEEDRDHAIWGVLGAFDSSTGYLQWRTVSGRDIGDSYLDLCRTSESVRIKYKSTPHLATIIKTTGTGQPLFTTGSNTLPLVEIGRDYNVNTFFGGQSTDALKANKWIPISDPVDINTTIDITSNRGDTYFQRFECLKTYAYTTEDTNQVVDIASFLVETHINIDGRYDRNRGQLSNLNMSPINFNLYNPVYSQIDNFFNYQILEDDYYKITDYPNQITWTKEKQLSAIIDNWTNITMASTYNMDGNKGKIRALKIWNDNIYCFQDKAINNILFNSRVQIPTSDGIPIEISNNYKVEGKRVVSEDLGCINKFTICISPIALYFIDSVGNHLQAISAQGMADLAMQKNITNWFDKQKADMWKPLDYTLKVFYDNGNNDLYIMSKEESLCYSEAVGQFTSFMSYSNIPVMCNIMNNFYSFKDMNIYKMFAGNYNYFFNEYKGYDITFIANGKSANGKDISAIDKVFSNLNFRADRWTGNIDSSTVSTKIPFDYIKVWNEYQDTKEVILVNTNNKPSNTKKKFRVWRIQIPRDFIHKRDRMRNTWCKIKLGTYTSKEAIQLHDLEVQYYI
jgi:hypothetical protein